MVAAPMTRWRRLVTPTAAALMVLYLAVMVIQGALPRQRQFVEFQANGVLKIAPDLIRRVELTRASSHLDLLRLDRDSWATAAGTHINASAATQINTALEMMHNSGPARELTAEDVKGTDLAEFGLLDPRITATLYAAGNDPVLTIHFGARNPDEFLQYMRIDSDARLYLMSRFIGETWTGAFDASLP
jgi:hypothetical protein